MLLADLPDETEEVIGDRGYDSNKIRQSLACRNITACIPAKKNRKSKPPYNWDLYKKRHLIENMFAKLKDWRRVVTRYDRCAHTFMSAIHIVTRFIFYLKRVSPEPKAIALLLNPDSEWVIQDVPELRIIEQDLWDAVKARQSKTTWSQQSRGTGVHPLNALQRSTHLLTGLIKCGGCGGGFSMISKSHLGCSTARNKGTCDNRLTLRRDVLEKSVLNGLQTQMMAPTLFKEFCDEFTREVNRLRMEKGVDLVALKSELPKIERELDKAIQAIQAIQAILDGVPGSRLKERIGQLEAAQGGD